MRCPQQRLPLLFLGALGGGLNPFVLPRLGRQVVTPPGAGGRRAPPLQGRSLGWGMSRLLCDRLPHVWAGLGFPEAPSLPEASVRPP